MFIAVFFTVAKTWKPCRCSVVGWVDKGSVVCVYTMEYHSTTKIRKSCHLQQQGWTSMAYANWNKPDRERQILYDITYMWNLSKLKTQKKRTDWWLLEAEGNRWRWSKGRNFQTYLVIPWLGIPLPVHQTRVWLLVQKDSICPGAAKLRGRAAEARML